VESLSGLSPEEFTLFLLPLSQIENNEDSYPNLPRLFIEGLLNFRWSEVTEGEDREILIQGILALSEADLAELLSLSPEEVLARLKG
jgi:hypothetical protein